jgi:hypothetical protein
MFAALNAMMLDMLAAVARKDYEDRRRQCCVPACPGWPFKRRLAAATIAKVSKRAA